MQRPQQVPSQSLLTQGTPEEPREVVKPPTGAGGHRFHGVWVFTGAAMTLLPGSVSEVFAFLADPANQTWLPWAKTLTRVPEGPIGVGTIFASTHRWGRHLARQEVTRYHPNHLIELHALPSERSGKGALLSSYSCYTVQEAASATQVDLKLTIEIKSFFLKCVVALFIPVFLLLPYAAIAFLLVLLFHFGEPPAEFDLEQANLRKWKSRFIMRWMAEDELAQWKRAFESSRSAGSLL